MPDPQTTAADLALFVAPDQVTELRALHVGQKGRTFAGWFTGDRLNDMARHALALARQSAGVYFVPAPIDPTIAHKRLNNVLDVHRGFALTADADVLERRLLIVDLDPGRIDARPDAPSSGRELAFALRVARRYVRPFLADLGFKPPVVMLSGNGVHLAYQMAPLPGNRCGSTDPAATMLRLLDERFSCYGCRIDPNTYNPCRMLKVPGTAVRKGEASPSRPHRTARILEIPDGWKRPAAGSLPNPHDARPVAPERNEQPAAGRPAGKPAARPAAPAKRRPPAERPEPRRLFEPGSGPATSH